MAINSPADSPCCEAGYADERRYFFCGNLRDLRDFLIGKEIKHIFNLAAAGFIKLGVAAFGAGK